MYASLWIDLKAFLALAGESISERESKRFGEGLNTKVKLTLYKTFGKAIYRYLHGVADAGSRLFRSGTHGLNEELGRHRGRENVSCVVMSVRVSVMCCGSVQHNIVTVELTSC